MSPVCQELIDKFGGKVVHEVGPQDYIHPAIIDVVDWAVGDDPLWKNNPHLASYRARKKAKEETDRNLLLRTEKDTLQSYLKRLKHRARRASYAIPRS
jgi:hypothetical protein